MYPTITELPDNVTIERAGTTQPASERWVIRINGQSPDGSLYEDEEKARSHALHRLEAGAALAVVEETIGGAWPYDITVTSEPRPGNSPPIWRITDPHRDLVNYAFAWHLHTPPPVDVYTRDQYEAACAALGFAPVDDEHVVRGDRDRDDKGGRSGALTDLHRVPARDSVVLILRRRRHAGMEREESAAEKRAREEIVRTVGDGPYTREQYEQATAIAGVSALTDQQCVAILEDEMSRYTSVMTITVPVDGLAADLAVQRADAIAAARSKVPTRPCGECGTPIPQGAGMAASLGLACRVECFDAMADRPGRYDSSH